MKFATFLVGTCIALSACGGPDAATSDSAEPSGAPELSQPPQTAIEDAAGPLVIPDWFVVDEASGAVRLAITAGATEAKNYWNFNGYTDGEIVIVVPEGTNVTIDFSNADPAMAHSLGLSRELANFAMPPAPDPAFPGAITKNPTSMVSSTLPGESETIEFVADEAGRYSLVCYIAGHTAVGMWIFFEIAADASVGVRGL